MAKKMISVEVSKEAHDVGVLMADVVVKLLQKKPIAEIAVGELAQLKEAVDGMMDIGAEAKEDPAAFSRAILIPASDILAAALAKAAEPAVEPAPAPAAE